MAAGMPRMAFAQAFGRHKAALQGAILANGFKGISGATWVKAAILPEEGANAQLISAYQ